MKEVFEILNKEYSKVIRKWTETRSHKAYTFRQAGSKFAHIPSKDTWMPFKYQLDEFVNHFKGQDTRY